MIVLNKPSSLEWPIGFKLFCWNGILHSWGTSLHPNGFFRFFCFYCYFLRRVLFGMYLMSGEISKDGICRLAAILWFLKKTSLKNQISRLRVKIFASKKMKKFKKNHFKAHIRHRHMKRYLIWSVEPNFIMLPNFGRYLFVHQPNWSKMAKN